MAGMKNIFQVINQSILILPFLFKKKKEIYDQIGNQPL